MPAGLNMAYSPRHAWYYFPDMQPDEALAFRDFLLRVGTGNVGADQSPPPRTDRGHADCRRLAVILVHDDRDVRVGFDGGVDQGNCRRVIDAGADALVAGTATFRGGPERYAENIRGLRGQ